MKATLTVLVFSIASAATPISTDSFPLTQDKTYSNDQFEGLYKYLEETTCDGPKLLELKIEVAVIQDDEAVKNYLSAVDLSLYASQCLSYH